MGSPKQSHMDVNNNIFFGCFFLLSGMLILLSCSSADAPEQNHTLSVGITPAEGGSVVPGSGVYSEGSQVEILAEPNTNWRFSRWSGDITSENNPVTVTINRDLALTAEFAPLAYPLDIKIEGDGTIQQELIHQKSEEYVTGSLVQLTAVAANGWFFAGWGGDLDGSENPATIEMDSPKEVIAVFEKKAFTFEVESVGEGDVSVELISGELTDDGYLFESILELTATPDEGWLFTGWSGNIESQENPATITITKNLSITASFEIQGFLLTLSLDGEGMVDQEIVNPKSTNYDFGTLIQLTAKPSNGWRFYEWSGDLDGTNNPTVIEMDNDKDVTARFERRAYSLSLSTDGEGTLQKELISGTETDDGYLFESVVRLTAEPVEGWEFVQWSGSIQSQSNPIDIEILDHLSITAEFKRIDYTLTIQIDGNGDVEQRVVQPKSVEYPYETVVELTAVPDPGWEFREWGGDISGSKNPTTITIDQEKTVTALFERKEYSLDISIQGNGSVSASLQSGTETANGYLFESVIELLAQADDGWEFFEWTGGLTGSQNPASLEIDRDLSVTAVFVPENFPITIQIEGEGSVTKTLVSGEEAGSGYTFGSIVELTAVPEDGWEFSSWSGDADSDSNPVQVEVTNELNVTATFIPGAFSLSIATDGNGSVETELISGELRGEDYVYQSEVRLTAIPDDGWEFFDWTGGLTGTQNPATLEMDRDLSVTAVFVPENFPITIQIEGEGTVTKTLVSGEEAGSGYTFGSIVELTAVPEGGWEFSSWSGDADSDSNPVQVEVTSELNVTATFIPGSFTLSIATEGNGSVETELVSGELRGDKYVYQSEVRLTAIPDDRWEFFDWTGGLTGTQNPATLEMDRDLSVTAVFEQFRNQFTVEMSLQDNRGEFDMQFGQDSSPELLRRLAPPPPPAGALNAYFRYDGTNYVRDFRQDSETNITWELRYQAGNGSGLELVWKLNTSVFKGNLIISDSDESFEVNMLEEDRISLPDGEDGVLTIQFIY